MTWFGVIYYFRFIILLDYWLLNIWCCVSIFYYLIIELIAVMIFFFVFFDLLNRKYVLFLISYLELIIQKIELLYQDQTLLNKNYNNSNSNLTWFLLNQILIFTHTSTRFHPPVATWKILQEVNRKDPPSGKGTMIRKW